MEKRKAGTKEKSPDSLSLPNQYRITTTKIYFIMEKVQWNSIDKKQYYHIRKMTNHPPSPVLAGKGVIGKFSKNIFFFN